MRAFLRISFPADPVPADTGSGRACAAFRRARPARCRPARKRAEHQSLTAGQRPAAAEWPFRSTPVPGWRRRDG
ncbi:hypothetical protein G6F32_017489 [Rhizopus arrhizus]|nr:hypothetical protein G6F32_017489 [Rhizopus arrhizus]